MGFLLVSCFGAAKVSLTALLSYLMLTIVTLISIFLYSNISMGLFLYFLFSFFLFLYFSLYTRA